MRTGQIGQVGDPSDTDQMSEGPSLHHGNSKQPIFAVDNVEQLPVFINNVNAHGAAGFDGAGFENTSSNVGAGMIIVPQQLH